MNDKTLYRKPQGTTSIKLFFEKREALTFGILVSIWAVLSIFNKNYASLSNLSSIMKTLSFYGIISVGLSFVIIQGDTDMSTGASAGFAAVLGTAIMVDTRCLGMQGTQKEWVGVIACVIIVMMVSMIIGLVNATMVVRLNMPPFIATTAMKFVLTGCVMLVTSGSYVYPLPASFVAFGKSGITVGNNFTISSYFIILIVLMLIANYILNFTQYGRSVYAIGSNRISAQLAGIKTNKVRYTNYMVLHALAALSGVLNAAYITQGSPNIGRDWELLAIASCAIGGIKMSGGAGNMTGLIIGLFALFSINSAIAYIGINTFLQDVVIGTILVLIVISDKLNDKRKIRA